jgi:hypothetical protein
MFREGCLQGRAYGKVSRREGGVSFAGCLSVGDPDVPEQAYNNPAMGRDTGE